MADYLFAYGTLRTILWPAALRRILPELRCLGSAVVRGRLYDLGPYPAAILDAAAGQRIRGEVLELPPRTSVLSVIDTYEECEPGDAVGSLFLRLRCDAEFDDGRVLSVWIYVYNRDPGSAPLVADGDYVRWLAELKPR